MSGEHTAMRFSKRIVVIKDSKSLIFVILISGAAASLFAAEPTPPGASVLGYGSACPSACRGCLMGVPQLMISSSRFCMGFKLCLVSRICG